MYPPPNAQPTNPQSWHQASLPPDASDEAARLARRVGAVGIVPWTFAQTLAGAAVMLVPWFAFLLTSASAGSSTAPLHPLSHTADALGGIVTFLFTAIVEGAFLLVPLYFVISRRLPDWSVRDGLRALGLRRVNLRRAVVVWVLALAFIFVLSWAYAAVVNTFHLPLQVNTDVLLRQARYAPLTTLGELLGSVLVAPFCEEVFFRGFLFAGLLRRMSLWPALLLSALLFALAHGDLGSFVVLFGIGCALAVARWRVGSLWPSVAIHMTNNLLAALSVYIALTH